MFKKWLFGCFLFLWGSGWSWKELSMYAFFWTSTRSEGCNLAIDIVFMWLWLIKIDLQWVIWNFSLWEGVLVLRGAKCSFLNNATNSIDSDVAIYRLSLHLYASLSMVIRLTWISVSPSAQGMHPNHQNGCHRLFINISADTYLWKIVWSWAQL